MAIHLRQYQRDAGNAWWRSRHKYQRQMIVLPTGTGKTVLGLSIAKAIGGRLLWIGHRDELVTQPYDTCKIVWPEARRGIVKARRDEHDAQCVFASVQTIQRDSRASRLGVFDLVVLDECHHSNAASWKRAAENAGCFAEGGPRLLGLTATPERSDNKSLADIFQNVAYVYHITQAVSDGYLVPIRYEQHRLELDLGGVKLRRNGDFDEADLDAQLVRAGIVDEICKAVLAHRDRKTLIFTVSVAQSQAVAEQLKTHGIRAEEVNGKTPTEIRRARIRRLARGDLQCLTNCAIFTEGFDEPTIDCVIMARPTKSKPLYIQCLGRGLRIAPNKKDCLVIDMVGASDHHSLIQAPVIFGNDDQVKREIRRQYEPDPDVAEWNEKKLMLGQIKGLQPVARSSMRWVNCKGGIAISAGKGGTVVARRDGELWTVSAIKGQGVTMLVDGACLELAQGVAEDYVRRCEASGWVDKGARWRTEQATPKQLAALARLKVPLNGDLTKGEASDMMTNAIASSWKFEPASKKQLYALSNAGIEFKEGITKLEAKRLLFGGKTT
jgi:superfamily II DNA or RNA helicase